jgi:predicted transcriptional regulator
MINELSLLKLHPENASTKQKIISILSERWPLSAKQIYENMKKHYSANISYQAIHKMIKELEEEKLVERKDSNYQLNINWIQQSKKTFEYVEKQYLKNNKISIPKDFSGTIEIEWDSFTDLCVSTAELLLSRQLAEGSDDPSFITTMEYGWWAFKFKFEHLYLLYDMVMHNPKAKGIIRKQTPYGEWIAKQYTRVGAMSAPEKAKLDFEGDMFVQGDCIIQVTFNNQTKKLFEQYYNKWHNLEESFIEFGLKPEPKIHATMRITKNKEMADFMRKQMNKVFEAKK